MQDIISEVYVNSNNLSLFEQLLKRQIIKPWFKLVILNPRTETDSDDISEYVLDWNLSATYQNGIRRTLSITLSNADKHFIIHPFTGNLWHGTKFRLDVGIIYQRQAFKVAQGVFVLPSVDKNLVYSDDKISLSLSDKFIMFENSMGGATDLDFIIKNGTLMRDAVYSLVHYGEDENNPIDIKPIIIDSKYYDTVIEYDIEKNTDTNFSEFLIEVAQIPSMEIYYDNYGNMTLSSGIDDLANVVRPVMWTFKEDDIEFLDGTYHYNFDKLVNKVRVVGGVFNGKVFDAEAVNSNPASLANTQINRVHQKNVSDDNIYSDRLAQDRADYELYTSMREFCTVSCNCTLLPHLDVNNIIIIDKPELGIINEKFLINSLSMNFDGTAITMSFEACKVNEMPFVS